MLIFLVAKNLTQKFAVTQPDGILVNRTKKGWYDYALVRLDRCRVLVIMHE